jgi:RNA polymerase sigma-70 factor (ECF subfamily)
MKTNISTDVLSGERIDAAGAEGLFLKYGPMVLRRCRRILGDEDEAADAVQEVFMKLLENKTALTAEFLSSLLWRIATNHCLNALRDRARRGANADGESLLKKIACSRDLEAQAGSRGVLRKLFGRHPESSRAIAALHLVDGMTLEETAREVNMSVSGVRKRLRALRDTLSELEGV